MMIPMKESILAGLLGLGLTGTQCSCVMGLEGAGKTGVAYDSTSRAYIFHEVDGDKEGKTSRSEMDLEPLLNMILEYQAAQVEDPAPGPDSEPNPDSESETEVEPSAALDPE